MKLQNTAILAVLASSAFANAAPTVAEAGQQANTQRIVKRQDVNEIFEYLDELKQLKVKRDDAEVSEDVLLELDKRADSVLGNLISALSNSGLIGDVINDLTSNDELKSSIVAIVKATLQAALVQGPTLIKAIWNSGMLQDIFNTIMNDSDLRLALLAAAKSLFGTAMNLLSSFFGSSSSSSKREIDLSKAIANFEKRSAIFGNETPKVQATAEKREAEMDNGDILSERDLFDVVSQIILSIYDSGIVQSLISKIMEDPEATIEFLGSALKQGVVILGDVYDWAKSSGIVADAIGWLENSDSGIISTLGEVLATLLGTGDVSADEIDNAGSSTTTATTKAATTAATTGAGTTTDMVAAATGDSTDYGFLSKYAQEGATTLYRAKRMAY